MKLSLALQSVKLRIRIRFTYKGTPRLVHPGTVRFQNYKWYFSGVEDGAELVKHFVVSEMSGIALDLEESYPVNQGRGVNVEALDEVVSGVKRIPVSVM